MRTSIFAVALAVGAPVLAQAQSPTWNTDYAAAQQKVAAQRKPLAIVFGQGENGWLQLGGGTVPAEAGRTLTDKYVCLYVDTATPAGLELARKFEMTRSIGIVLSDRTGGLQAFWHEGTLSADLLTGYLGKYADPSRPVVTTETNPPIGLTSYYPPSGASTAPVCRT